MKNKILKGLCALAISLTMVACGGGGGGGSGGASDGGNPPATEHSNWDQMQWDQDNWA